MKKKGNSMIYILFIIYVILSSSGLVLFKLGTTGNGINILGFVITLKMILGIFCYGLSFILWLYIISKLNLTFAMPLSVAIINTLVVVESCIFLNEKITIGQGVGIFMIILGVTLITVYKA